MSVAELAAVFDLKEAELLAPDFLFWETDLEIEADNLIKRLGGVIKIGRVVAEQAISDQAGLIKTVIKVASQKQKNSPSGKFNFGFSDYGVKQFNKKDLGIKLKNYFNDQDISSRFVVSQEKTLSSVVITQNKLISRGIEIVLTMKDDKIIIGETLSVQPFKDLSRRDFGRPARDDQSGMLPPKLAQIMINLAALKNFEAVIVDPFCGSGTILSEAMLLGYKNLFGSDVALKAVEDTRKNISWTKELYDIKDSKLKLQVKNAIYLSKFMKAGYVDAIITEPFLGPQRGMINFKVVIRDLEELYSASLREFYKVLKSGSRVVMIWPLFYGQKPITPNIQGFRMIKPLPLNLLRHQAVKMTNRQTIVYGRAGQKVYREIIILEKE